MGPHGRRVPASRAPWEEGPSISGAPWEEGPGINEAPWEEGPGTKGPVGGRSLLRSSSSRTAWPGLETVPLLSPSVVRRLPACFQEGEQEASGPEEHL